MASSGIENYNRNWKGSNHESTVKKACPYYQKTGTGSFSRIGNLNPGTPVVYIDSATQSHTKAAIQLSGDQNTYYVNVDNLVKPRSSARSVPLSPASFGLENSTYSSSTTYYNSVISALNSRSSNEIDGELFDYLFELLEYAKKGTNDYDGIKLSGFPWGQIQNYYGEVLGPLACIHRGVLNGIVPTTGLASAHIYMPPDSEALYDYKIIVGNAEYRISAKSARGVSNQVKPQLIVPVVQGNLPRTLINSEAYNLVKILADYSVKEGAFYGWQLIQDFAEITPGAISDMAVNYAPRTKKSTDKIVDIASWDPFLRRHFAGRNKQSVTYGQLRYKCEKLIETKSKTGILNRDLKSIFNVYLNESRVIYVKLNLNTASGIPTFTASAGGESSLVRRLYLRSSNDSVARTSDRIGFQVS